MRDVTALSRRDRSESWDDFAIIAGFAHGRSSHKELEDVGLQQRMKQCGGRVRKRARVRRAKAEQLAAARD